MSESAGPSGCRSRCRMLSAKPHAKQRVDHRFGGPPVVRRCIGVPMVGTEQQARTRERKHSDGLNYRIENPEIMREWAFWRLWVNKRVHRPCRVYSGEHHSDWKLRFRAFRSGATPVRLRCSRIPLRSPVRAASPGMICTVDTARHCSMESAQSADHAGSRRSARIVLFVESS